MKTDVSEKGLELLIVGSMTGKTPAEILATASVNRTQEEPAGPPGAGYLLGDPHDYDREHAVDGWQLLRFLADTQPGNFAVLGLEKAGTSRQAFLHRLQGEVTKRGVVDVLRKGIKHGPASVDLFYGTPTPGNPKAAALHALNRFSVTRQLRYSQDDKALALDFALFVNGLPVATFELKNSLTKQTVADAVEQYRCDRHPRELLFSPGRCMAHFAVDDQEVRFCAQLTGKASWFLPFNQGFNDGAGNPPNPSGLATDYLWKETLTRASLTNILERYAQVVEDTDRQGRKKRQPVFPRYHQLDVVRRLLARVATDGAGHRYLIEHSAGSGKSNSIAWLAHQLVGLTAAEDGQPVFDSVIVVTDRTILDRQIRDTIRQFAQVSAVVGAVTQGSGQLRGFIKNGKKIIISTIQKFPHILEEIGNEHRGRRFAILIDEAHSSQGGRTAAKMQEALSAQEKENDEGVEERINRIIEARKLLPNASYFAFTATPKNKTLELFGARQADGSFRSFHRYSMQQAIEEGFILDVLRHYTPVKSYYRLVKTVEHDPEFDAKRAKKKLGRYVEGHDHAIRAKAEIMVDHFHEHVFLPKKIGGRARAMVVANGIERAIQYFQAFNDYLIETKSPHRAIVAFSGDEHEVGGRKVGEADLNGFPSGQIPERFVEDPYRFLIVADKFQTGYDEPLLHTMYVDKPLSGGKAVQTLSRLNRACPGKHDTFVLDFFNDAAAIQEAFQRHYQGTVLSEATDPNKLHDLRADLDVAQVYAWADVVYVADSYLAGTSREEFEGTLQKCVAAYQTELNEDGQVDFKGKAKGFVRLYSFLAAVLPYTSADWERLSIFLNFLVPKLPAPKEDNLTKGILENIDMDSYRTEAQAQMALTLAKEEGEVAPVPTGSGGGKPEPELDRLSRIVQSFNDLFGNVEWKDADKIRQLIAEEIPQKVNADPAYQNARKHSDKQNARIESDRALGTVMIGLLKDHTELFKQFSDNPSFKRWLSETVFSATYEHPAAER